MKKAESGGAASRYYGHNYVVVSGGQGMDEEVSEAFAMKEYLTNKGISEDRIIMEDKSTNTLENIKNTKVLDF